MKIIEFFGEPLSYGGQESFILNMYGHFVDDNDYIFCTPFHADNAELKKMIEKKGDEICSFGYHFDSKLRKLYIYKTAKRIINEKYDVVHVHSGSILTLLMVAMISRKKKIKEVIVHSHATGYNTFSHKIVKRLSDILIENYATKFIACSKEAGKFKFPENVVKNNLIIVKNGIDLRKFIYNKNIREKKRKEFEIEDKKVLCNVGRFSKEKNHIFIINVFVEYLKLEKNAFLLLIGGNGEEEIKIRHEIAEKGIDDKVLILKNRTDINEILSAVDVFIFPSQFEGLGISAIEAQASGLPTICACHLPDELNASSNYIEMDLQDTPQNWAYTIYENQNNERKNCYSELKKAGYEISDSARYLEKIYEGYE